MLHRHLAVFTTKIFLLLALLSVILTERFDKTIDTVRISNRIKINYTCVQYSFVQYCMTMLRMEQGHAVKIRL